ncbi:MAG: gamma-glutamyltransferase family protein [Pseudomonadales bacterium]|nr:gamma-glutamyltransferase family protein [Pseudomonadales bacterium]
MPAGAAAAQSEARHWPHGGMVSVANPLAAEAAAEVLARGGHAVDAAIAAHAVLGLVEPQSSGLGGGAFMLVYDRVTGAMHAYDGRETAPAGARADMFLVDGAEMGFLEAWQSGMAVGVPGVVALYDLAHRKHGKLDLGEDVARAIQLATEGFTVSPRLAGFLEQVPRFTRLEENPDTAAYFYPNGRALTAGARLKNPDYARTLSRVIAEGPAAFYGGDIATAMVKAARAEPNPGTLSLEDLTGYRVAERKALCALSKGQRICTMPPPSSGLAEIMILGLYDRLTADRVASGRPLTEGPHAPGSFAAAVSLPAFVDAQRLAYADRDHYVADGDMVDVPVGALLDAAYLDVRARERFPAQATPVPGDPGAVVNGMPIIDRWGQDNTDEAAGTTHLSIVDTYGNAVAMTATVEAVFGSSRWAAGFLLNNQMTDFARTPTLDGRPVANAVAPGKRPRSSMSPVIVLDESGELLLVSGSPGGNSIIAYVAKTLVGVLRGGVSVQEAVAAPNIVARGAVVRVESGVAGGAAAVTALTALGYPVQAREGENSGLHVILRGPDGLEGAADPRREGRVIPVAPPR